MRKSTIGKAAAFTMAAVMAMATLAGCGSQQEEAVEVIPEEQIALEAEPETAKEEPKEAEAVENYFTKGVYVNYAADAENPDKTYFYVFNGDGSGYTDDGIANTGTYFDYEQVEGGIKFSFGAEDPIEDVLTVKSFENGVVTGYFENTFDLVFEPVTDADPDDFDAVNYVNATKGEDYVYTDANGWRIKYDPDKFVINKGGSVSTIVYVGESAGTNMITVTYTVENKAEDAVKAIGEPYGDKAYYTQSPFPGAEKVTGYYLTVAPDTEGTGSYKSALARDYMDGALVFEIDGHMGNDEAMNMEVSDSLAAIIDSIEFPYEN
ncbi:MAG: hypothetical protein K6F75_04645 [Butyrivibrio sp.]|nr:hypothetical protein [Butyrivibrio sp.]